MNSIDLLLAIATLLHGVKGTSLENIEQSFLRKPQMDTLSLSRGVDSFLPKRCFKNLGCFSCAPPFFHPIWRPVCLLPQKNVKPKFLLYTTTSLEHPYQLYMRNSSVIKSPFDAELPTKVLIPGFLYRMKDDKSWLNMKDELLKAGKFNVILVDWEEGNSYPFEQAVANARKVGAQTAYLLYMLNAKKGLKYEDVHLIGHSLGAHISGWIGKRLNKISRISGLDPARPYFVHAPPKVRLDKTDALFVDIIHSEAGSDATQSFKNTLFFNRTSGDDFGFVFGHYGLKQNIGNEDFYPNGGSKQPGCNEPAYYDVRNETHCSHKRATLFFVASVNKCRFLAVQCDSYKRFEDGDCTKENSLVLEMGYHAKKVDDIKGSTMFFLKTTASPPYCSKQDRIINT